MTQEVDLITRDEFLYANLPDKPSTPTEVVGTHTYSTSEHKIGTWTDGSDLYEITISTNTASSVGTEKRILSTSGKTVRRFYGIIDGYYSLSLPCYDASETITMYIDGGYLNLVVSTGNGTNKHCYITIEYTKN